MDQGSSSGDRPCSGTTYVISALQIHPRKLSLFCNTVTPSAIWLVFMNPPVHRLAFPPVSPPSTTAAPLSMVTLPPDVQRLDSTRPSRLRVILTNKRSPSSFGRRSIVHGADYF
ncbi:unnamed protein product [Cyclocybe aegerita]|uniref:Uncharacterized protein n=1 Tax=Cyclocybe aegerita TaxID=1973307 RepID=A0A8S0Y0B5_CYCAE|nr:unnamed protein product [Cyclocybe aegerita]